MNCKLKNDNCITVTVEKIHIDEPLESLILEELEIKKGMIIFNSSHTDNFGYNKIGFKNPPVEIRFINKKIEIVALNYKGMPIMAFLHRLIKSKFPIFTIEEKKHKISFIFSKEIQDEYKKKNKVAMEVLEYVDGLITLESSPFFSLYGVVENQTPVCRGKVADRPELDDRIYSMILYIPDEIYLYDKLKKETVKINYDIELSEICNIEIPMYVEDYALPEVASKYDLSNISVYKTSNIFKTLMNEDAKECFIINTGRGVIVGTSDYTYLDTFIFKGTL